MYQKGVRAIYLQLEKGESINKNEIIGIFDIELSGLAQGTKNLFKRKEEEKGVISLPTDLPRSFVVCDGEYDDRIYLTGLSTETIRKRLETNGIKTIWTR